MSARAALTIVDVDALRLRLARANLAAYGRTATALQADVTAAALPEADGLWFDPARRVGGRRKFSVRDYHPSLAIVRHWLARTPTLGVKISPGVDLDELAEVLGEDGPRAEVEFISVDRELKECALWFGPLKTAARRATLLPGPHTLTADPRAASVVGAPGRYLFEPDPAVLRAGLVTTLAVQLGARQLDPEIAYLAADAPSPTPFARTYSVEDAFPFQLKRLREYLRARGVGQVTVKKRGSPLEPEALIRSLRLAGDESRIVFLTQVAGKPHVLIGQAV